MADRYGPDVLSEDWKKPPRGRSEVKVSRRNSSGSLRIAFATWSTIISFDAAKVPEYTERQLPPVRDAAPA